MKKFNNLSSLGRVVMINFSVLLFLLFAPSIILSSYRKLLSFSRQVTGSSIDQRSNLPVYNDKKFSNQLFSELQKSTIKTYRSFIGWRREPIKYINVGGVYNTRLSLGESLENSAWFFGGSTMFGAGSEDTGTIPSIFHLESGKPVMNFGESGYVSRQSLNLLISVIGDGYKPETVIFFDGANDVEHNCRSELSNVPSHSREMLINKELQSTSEKSKRLIISLFDPYLLIAGKLNIIPSKKSEYYDCHKNKAKAQSIASHLVNNWYAGYLISESNDSEFYAILQPTIFSSNTSSDYLKGWWKEILPTLKTQFEIVYPLVKKEIKNKCNINPSFCSRVIDGTKWISKDSNVFIDYIHVTKEGNEIIVKSFLSYLEK